MNTNDHSQLTEAAQMIRDLARTVGECHRREESLLRDLNGAMMTLEAILTHGVTEEIRPGAERAVERWRARQ